MAGEERKLEGDASDVQEFLTLWNVDWFFYVNWLARFNFTGRPQIFETKFCKYISLTYVRYMSPKHLFFKVIILGENISLVIQFFDSALSVYFFEAPDLVFS